MIHELSLSLATSYKSPKMDELSKKMSYLVAKNKSDSPYFFDLTLWKTESLFLESIEKGIEQSRQLAFEYTTFQGETTTRTIEPINLVFKSNVWYVYGFCHLREDMRLFRVNRIREVRLLTDSFESKKYDSLTKDTLENFYSSLENRIKMIPVVLEFDLQAKAKVYDSFLEKDIKEQSNKIIVEKDLPKERWLVEMLLSFGGSVKIISPEWLKNEIITETKKILTQYDIGVSS